jgi:hypothetical protein
MTRRWPCIVVTMLFTLLAFARSASAEGAWVLWLDVTQIRGGKTEEEWTTLGTHRSEKDCEESLKETMALQSRVDPGETAEKLGENLLSKNTALGDIFLRYICLPDIVDPRGPPGK